MKVSELESVWSRFTKKKSDKLRNQLIEHYYPYVKKIASTLAQKLHFKVSAEELTSHGLDGLYRAISAFDISRGIKFETYSYRRIKGSMIDAIRQQDWVPRSVRQRADLIETTKNRLESKLGRRVDLKEVLSEAKISETDYHKNVSKYNAAGQASIESNDQLSSEEDTKKDFNKYLAAKTPDHPEGKFIRKEFFKKLFDSGFNDLERKIIYYHYYESFTMKKISEKLQISESRASQIHHQVLKRLRAKLENEKEYFDNDVLNYIAGADRSSLLDI
tara:strand:+ start:778 stop:1602 length:825 start_codon:yes stop_codon:yes gene_type:complete